MTSDFDALHATRARLRAEALAGRAGLPEARALSDAYDQLLTARFDDALAAHPLPGAALLAVGGYGRGAVGLGSDVDVVLLVEDVDDPRAHRLAEALLHPLWDAKVSVGHAVRSPDALVALARSDVRTATAALDARLVAGDADAARDCLARAVRHAWEGDLTPFLDGLSDEMRARHRRYGATVYLLEPDVKHSRGGLRDLDIARWALRARSRARGFAEALRVGALGEAEAAGFEEAEGFLWRVRQVLHARAGRRNDRLSFDEQEEVAARLFPDEADPDAHPVDAVGASVERLMSTWYRHARAVAAAASRVLERCRPARGASDHPPRTDRVVDDIARFEDALCFTHADALRRAPALALRILELAVARAMPLASGTREAIAAAARDPAWCEALRASPEAASSFLRLVSSSGQLPRRARDEGPVSVTEGNEGSVLAEAHDLGLVLAMIPEFAHVTGRAQHDLYHVYTVDVHSVAAVDRLHALARDEGGDELSLAARTAAETERADLVCLATLLHDIGKRRGGDHSRIGAAMAAPIARRLGLGDDDADAVAWLVAEHLTLYHAATRRDPGDPATLAALVDAVRDPWRLRALYLLTVADVSTTSPTAMTSWKARVLEELFLRVEDALATGARLDERLARLRAQCLEHAHPRERAAVERHLARMPPRYLMATSPEAVARHARALVDVPAGARRVFVAPLEGDLGGELLEVLVTAPDRPGLLSVFAAMLYAARLDVQAAQVCSAGGDAVDVFVVRSTRRDPVDLARLGATLPASLDALLDGAVTPDALVATARGGGGIPRPEPAVKAEVHLHHEASEAATVVEVLGRDREGFLYAVTRAMHRLGLAIAVARVNTEGRRAADTFYVTLDDGAKVPPERYEEFRAALLDVVAGGGIVPP